MRSALAEADSMFLVAPASLQKRRMCKKRLGNPTTLKTTRLLTYITQFTAVLVLLFRLLYISERRVLTSASAHQLNIACLHDKSKRYHQDGPRR